MPIIQNGKKQKMIYKDGFPISKVYKGTILLLVETGFTPLGGLGVDMIGQDELGFSFSTHYDADDFISQ